MNKYRLLLTLVSCLYCCLSVADFERVFPLPADDSDIVGSNTTVLTVASETLVDIAARYYLGYNLIRSANPDVDAWLPGDDAEVLLPFQAILPAVPRKGIVINVPEMRLYFFSETTKKQTASVAIYPVSVGRGEWNTPVTKTRLTGRAKNPTWYPPKTIRDEHAARGDILPMQVPPGPDNPLGEYLLMLDIPSYFIHGTNKRFGIGMQVTHGCIRMYSQDIERLVKQAPNNTTVTIINQTFKTGWHDRQLYIEVHRPLENNGRVASINRADYVEAVLSAAKDYPDTWINWERFEEVISEASGVPVQVGYLAPDTTIPGV